MNNLLLVAAGGAIGASLRYLVNLGATRLGAQAFPWHTMAINIVGSLLMGLFVGWLARKGNSSDALRLFVGTGLLGGFTTFSAFSLEFAALWQRGNLAEALAYAAGSVVLSLMAIFLGLWLARAIP